MSISRLVPLERGLRLPIRNGETSRNPCSTSQTNSVLMTDASRSQVAPPTGRP